MRRQDRNLLPDTFNVPSEAFFHVHRIVQWTVQRVSMLSQLPDRMAQVLDDQTRTVW